MGQLPGRSWRSMPERADRQRRGGRKRDADHHQRGDYALADGPHAITARQTEVGKQPSPLSPPLTITIDTAGPVAEILAVAPNPRNTPVEAVDILLSEEVFGVAAGSFSLAIDGGGNLLSGEEPITSPDQQRYTLGGLSPMTQRRALPAGAHRGRPDQGPGRQSPCRRRERRVDSVAGATPARRGRCDHVHDRAPPTR